MSSLSVLTRLMLTHNLRRWPQALLGILGIAASVCLVVWIIRGYGVAELERASTSAKPASRYDILVAPPAPRPPMPGSAKREPGQPRRPPLGNLMASRFLDPQLPEQLRQDPQVARVVSLVRTQVRIVAPPAVVALPGPGMGASLIGIEDSEPPQPLAAGRWLAGPQEAVLAGSFAARYGLQVGSALTVGGTGGEARLQVVGVLPSPPGGGMGGMRRGPLGGPDQGDIYVAPAATEPVNGFGGRVTALGLTLKNREVAADFIEQWKQQTAAADPPLQFTSPLIQEEDPMAEGMLTMVAVQAQNATALAFLAAVFIIFTTLSAGVRARLREFASLRAIGMARGQLVSLIFAEAILYALLGWGVGLAAARLLLGVGNALARYLGFFQTSAFADVPLSGNSMLLAGACALVGSLIAAVLPAWRASRLLPLDILSAPTGPPRRAFPRILVGLGLLLVVVNPIIVLLARVEPFRSLLERTFSMGFGPPLLGSAALIVGLALITPGAVLLAEAVCGPLLALLLRLDRRFLRQQLTGQLWRTVGTTISLSAGLTLFVTALVWGYSMLVPFTPDASLPQMLVAVLPAGVPEQAAAELGQLPGVRPGEHLAMAVEQPRLTDAMLDLPPFASVDPAQEHLLFMGVDPGRAFGGQQPILNFDFLQGDRQTIAQQLAGGRRCLVPDHFHTQTGLGVGDRFTVEVPNAPGRTVEYEIAGVVSIPGWNWFTKFSEIRRRAGRALAVVFADYTQVKTDFQLDRVSYFWLNAAAGVTSADLEQQLLPWANRYAGVKVALPGVGETQVDRQYIKITEKADLTERLFRRANDVIWSLTRFPLLALIIASLAVFHTIFASVRSRWWQFGILRGVGLSRWQLFRLVLSESLLLFLLTGGLSLGAGLLLAWSGIHICTHFFFFAGRTPPLVLPWGALGLGFGIAFALCALAGFIPAWQAARREPLTFIQAGRLSE